MYSFKDPALNYLENHHSPVKHTSQLHSKAISMLLPFPHQSRTAPHLLYFVSWEGPCYFTTALGKPIEYL